MAKDISPEERLFNVIQKSKDSVADSKRIPLGPQRLKHFFLGLAVKLKHLTSLRPAAAGAHPSGVLPLGFAQADFKFVNKALGVILFILIVIVIYFLLGSKPSLLKITSAPSTGFIGIQSKIEDYKPLKVYIEEVKKRDIFRPVQAAGTVAKFSLQGLTKDLVLSGIYQGKYPEAIIEDKTTKKVYFLKEGDEVKGLKVKSILKDRVILQYGEEEVELL